MLQETLRFPKRRNISWCDLSPSTTYEIVSMHLQWWAFQHSTVQGVLTRSWYSDKYGGDPEDWGAIAAGYRCESCHRVFFAGKLSDFAHECMEPENK